MKRPLVVAKFGGNTLGVHGKNLPLVLERIRSIGKQSEVGPVVVFSAPYTVYEGRECSLTDAATSIGESYARQDALPFDALFEPYRVIADRFVKEEFKPLFKKELSVCIGKVEQALSQTLENRRFVDVNRARVLAYSGEVLTCVLIDYVSRSFGLNSIHFEMEEWPIVTDGDFESANFLRTSSSQRKTVLEDALDSGRVPIVGGYIGVTEEGLETTFERGGSDRTAVDLGIILSENYRVMVDFEKSSMVMSADPRIVNEDLQPVRSLSYNEANLAGMFGMKIVDPVAIRDILEADLDIPLQVTNMANPEEATRISSATEGEDGRPVKMVTGKKHCAICEVNKSKRDLVEGYVKAVRRYHDFLELRPYQKGRSETARFLFLDERYLMRLRKELASFDSESQVTLGLGAVTLVGDGMGRQPGIAAKTFEAVFESGVNIEDGDIQQPTSSILILVKNEDLDLTVKAIHSKMMKTASSS